MSRPWPKDHRLPIYGALIVVLTSLVVIFVAGTEEKGLSNALPKAVATVTVDNFAIEFKSRGFWIVSVIALLTMSIASTMASIKLLREHDKRHCKRWLRNTWCGAGLAFITALVISIFDSIWGTTWTWNSMSLLDTRLETLVDLIFHFLDSMAAIPIVFLIAGLSAVLQQSSLTWPPKPEALRCDMRSVRILLYMACLMLISGVFELFAAFNWVAANAAEDMRPGVLVVGGSLALGIGTLFSLFLALTYGPAILLQRQYAEHLAELALPEGTFRERQEWLIQAGLSQTLFDTAAKIFALLSPILAAGPLLELLRLMIAIR